MSLAKYKVVIGSVSGGLLYALSNVGYGLWPLAFVAMVPFWMALEFSLTMRPRFAFFAGLLFGTAIFGAGFPWLLSLSEVFLQADWSLSALLWVGVGLWFALEFVVYAFVYRYLRQRKVVQLLSGIAPFVLMEWLQPNLFPSYLGASLVNAPGLVQIADLGGPLLLSAFVLVINGLIFRFLISETPGMRLPCVGAGLFSLVIGYASLSERIIDQKLEDAPSLRVGAVQTNLVRLPKDELSLVSHKAHLAQSKDLLVQNSVDLLIWPETAYIRGLRRTGVIDGRFIREDIDTPILFGGTSVWQEQGKKVHANSVFLADDKGMIDQVYDKNMLIPFAEYLPFSGMYFSLFEELFPFSQTFKAGDHQRALNLDEWLIQTPICFEVIHHDFIRQSIDQSRPHFMVTLANDGWFGDSQEPWIHLSLARLRAIENRIWVVRATNSGISAVIDPLGNIVTQTGLNTKENLVATIYPVQSWPLFTIYGDWVAWLAIILLGIALVKPRESGMVASPSSS